MVDGVGDRTYTPSLLMVDVYRLVVMKLWRIMKVVRRSLFEKKSTGEMSDYLVSDVYNHVVVDELLYSFDKLPSN